MGLCAQSTEPGISTPLKICAHIFISFIGAGVLGLPYAFKEAGIFEGTFIMAVVGILSVKAMLLLVDCKYSVIERWETGDNSADENDDGLYAHVPSAPVERMDLLKSEELLVTGIKEPPRLVFTTATGIPDVSYGDIGFEAVGSIGKLLVDFSIVLSQIGFCCAYLIFICKNMSDMVQQVEMGHWLLIALPLLSLLTLFRHLNSLAISSMLAQISSVFAFSIVFWFDFKHVSNVSINPKEISLENIPFFFVVAVYCFEGAGLVLSLEGSLSKSKQQMFSKYFILVLVFITLLYILFGVCGYVSFGPETSQIITLNLGKGAGFDVSICVKSFLCLALFLTYPVMMFPVMKILEHYFIPDASKSMWKGNILRALVVLLTGMVIILIPNFVDLMALVGACCCTLLSFVLPGLFHLCLFRSKMSRKQYIIDWLLILTGVLGTIFGIWNAIVRLRNTETVDKTVSEMSTPSHMISSITENLLNATETFLQNVTGIFNKNISTRLLEPSFNFMTTGTTSIMKTTSSMKLHEMLGNKSSTG